MLTYKEWLLKFIDVDLPIGDNAKDVSADDNFPNVNDYETIFEYLESSNASDSFMRIFEYTYKMYYESTQ